MATSNLAEFDRQFCFIWVLVISSSFGLVSIVNRKVKEGNYFLLKIDILENQNRYLEKIYINLDVALDGHGTAGQVSRHSNREKIYGWECKNCRRIAGTLGRQSLQRMDGAKNH